MDLSESIAIVITVSIQEITIMSNSSPIYD